jgi:hypothetical protein
LASPATGWQFLLIAGVLLLAGIFAWQIFQRWSGRILPSNGNWNLGPWPVLPQNIASPAELILAFEYLALKELGLEAKNWNHQMICLGFLKKIPGKSEAAKRLAHLYEQIRYDPFSQWSEEMQTQARQDLVSVAGVFA